VIHKRSRDAVREVRVEPPFPVDFGKLFSFQVGIICQRLLLECQVRFFRVPAISTCSWVALDAATPIMRLAVETIPSFAPRTAARSQPER
jgi:hypothetical protein